ncbi:MAG: HDOD domain-containing protein [Desulfobulbaceae bacterium]|nr:HDOD domain-containing protein [Desulfobulbaceae bacterium]
MEKKRILFVDDEPNILDGMKRMLRSLRKGLDMHFAESGRKALEIMAQQPVDVVVSDMRMPGMNGAELLAETKEKYPQIIRIMLTGQADEKSVLRTIGLVHQFLAKPCEPERLKITLHRACLLSNLLTQPDLRKVVAGIDILPSLPSVYVEVQKLLADPDSSVGDVAHCISKDIGMSAKVLQLVNSAFFGLFQHVKSPEQAVHLLGLDNIKALVLTVQVFAQYEGGGMSSVFLKELMNHSMAVGACAQKIAEQAGNKELADHALIAGLMHDVGKLVLAANMGEEYGQALALAKDENVSIQEAEFKIFKAGHAEIGAYLLGLWGFPSPVIDAIAYHHRPQKYPGTSFEPLTAVYAANILAHEQGGLSGQDEYLARVGCLEQIENWRELCLMENRDE